MPHSNANSFAVVKLTKGQEAIIDQSSVGLIGTAKWQAQWSKESNTFYAYQTYTDASGKKRGRYMHRLILGAGRGQQVDHANHNGLDNRLENIRLCSASENTANTKSRGGSSGHKGVSYVANKGAWLAQITHQYQWVGLGYYETEDEAALAYNIKARELFGDFAQLNDVAEGPQPVRRCLYSSRIRGVSYHKQTGKWRAYLRTRGIHVHLGLFATEEEAIVVLNEAKSKEQDHVNDCVNAPVSGIGANQSAGETTFAC